jgi:PAS domain S-box-containing protein
LLSEAEELSEGLYLVDRNGGFVEVNPSGCRLLGLTREELLERGLEAVLAADERPRWAMQQRRCSDGAPLRGEWRFMRHHGGLFVGDVTTFRLPDGSLQCIVRDLTEYQNARSAKLQLAAIVESSTDAIVSKTLQGMVTSWNGGAENLFGYQADEIIGQSIRRLIPEERQSEEDQILTRIQAGERIVKYETARRRKDGRLIHVSLSISPIHDESGEIIGVSKIAQDITQHKHIEEALRESEKRLRLLADNMSQFAWMAHVRDRNAEDPGVARRGSGTADPGDRQPAHQCLQIHPARGAHLADCHT